MRKVSLLLIILLALTGIAFADKQQCYDDCLTTQEEEVQICIDTVWPLYKCVKKAGDDHDQCISDCLNSK